MLDIFNKFFKSNIKENESLKKKLNDEIEKNTTFTNIINDLQSKIKELETELDDYKKANAGFKRIIDENDEIIPSKWRHDPPTRENLGEMWFRRATGANTEICNVQEIYDWKRDVHEDKKIIILQPLGGSNYYYTDIEYAKTDVLYAGPIWYPYLENIQK